MGLDDLSNKAEKKAGEERVEELSEKLGVEDKEELERLDDRISTMSQIIVSQEQEIESMRHKIDSLEELLNYLIELVDK